MSLKYILFLFPCMLINSLYGMDDFRRLEQACKKLDVTRVKELLPKQKLTPENINLLRRALSEAAIPNAASKYYIAFWGNECGTVATRLYSIFTGLAAWLDLYITDKILNNVPVNGPIDETKQQPKWFTKKEILLVSNGLFYINLGILGAACTTKLVSWYLMNRYDSNIHRVNLISELIISKTNIK